MELTIKTQEEQPVESLPKMTISDFILKHHPSLTYPAIVYALKIGKINGIKEGRRWIIEMTDQTLRYNPIRASKKGRI